MKPAYAGPLTPGIGPGAAVFGTTVGEEADGPLRAAIAERPDAFAFQEAVPLSTTPAWNADAPDGVGAAVALRPARLVLRAFVAAKASGAGGYAVMPGGLGRVSGDATSRLTSMRRGGGAKDVWVVAPPAAEPATQAPADAAAGPPGSIPADRADFRPPTPAVRGIVKAQAGPLRGAQLPGRVADNLFWLGRYAERAEGMVRLLRAIGHRHADPAEPHPRELAALLRALAQVSGVADSSEAATAAATVADTAAGDVLAAIFDPRGPHGLASTLGACRRAGDLVRDRLSVDAWRILQRLGRDFELATPLAAAADPEDALVRRGRGLRRHAADPRRLRRPLPRILHARGGLAFPGHRPPDRACRVHGRADAGAAGLSGLGRDGRRLGQRWAAPPRACCSTRCWRSACRR